MTKCKWPVGAMYWPLMPPFGAAADAGAVSVREASELEDEWLVAPYGVEFAVPTALQAALEKLAFFESVVYARMQ
jgi:hypothetical protein